MRISKLRFTGTPLDFFSKLGTSERFPAYVQTGDATIIAWNPVKRWRFDGADCWAKLEKITRERRRSYRGHLPFIGGLIGYLSYDLGEEMMGITRRGRSRGPFAVFHAYDEAVIFRGREVAVVGNKKFAESVRSISARPASVLSLFLWGRNVSAPQKQRQNRNKMGSGKASLLQWESTMTQREYSYAFANIQAAILRGDIYQINLTYHLRARSEIDRRHLFHTLTQSNPSACASYLESDDVILLSASPESFLTIDGDRIETRPIKGTRPRGRNAAADQRLKRALLSDPKEQAELNMITDLLRNDIGQICVPGSVEVAKARVVQKNPTVWHTYSVIQGRLESFITPLEALQRCFPGGSVTGCPKKRAMEEIAKLEKARRGPYTGAMVMLSDHGALRSSVVIRTLVSEGDHLTLGVGGGIVADSDGAREWEETQRKAAAFLRLKA